MAAVAQGGVREGTQHELGARRPLPFLSDLPRTHIEMIELVTGTPTCRNPAPRATWRS